MSEESPPYVTWTPALPAVRTTADGRPRRIGVELELIGLEVATVSRLVAAFIGGTVDAQSRYEHFVHGDDAGRWIVELDYEYLKQKGRAAAPADELLELIDDAAESLIRAGAEAIVPVEVISPPLPMARLADVQTLIGRLRGAGALGSGAGLSYAFGMQFNPEMPALDSQTIVRYLKAFFCLYEWLLQRAAPDLTRRLTGFSAAFPAAYQRLVIDEGYWPGLDDLIGDYLDANPTRNRALDLLPLFAHLDETRVQAVVNDPRVKPRPTLHYRLPNCEIDDPDWGLHLAWNDWLEVEALAHDDDALQGACDSTIHWLDNPFGRLFDDRAREIAAWLAARRDR